MKQFSKSVLLGAAIVGVISGSIMLAGCAGTDNTATGPGVFISGQVAINAAVPVFKQVEQLARPAINEGLFTNNDDLNAYNSVLAFQEIPALAGSPQLFGDAGATLVAFASFGGDATATTTLLGATVPTRVAEEVTALLPDVLRIDTTVASPQDPSSGAGTYTTAYTAGAVPIGQDTAQRAQVVQQVVMPAGGRKFEDDVMDITFALLTNGATSGGPIGGPEGGAAGAATTQITAFKGGNGVTETITGGAYPGDGADYSSSAANDAIDPLGNPAEGHHLLRGQLLPFGQCNVDGFPYAPDPN